MNLLIKNKKVLDKIAWEVYNRFGNMEVDDLRQEAFLKGVEVIDKFDSNRASISTFLYAQIKGHLEYKCKRQFSYQDKKEWKFVQVYNNQEDHILEKTYIENLDQIIYKTDMNHAPNKVKKCLELISNYPINNQYGLVKEMKKQGIEKPYSILKETGEFFNQYNED